jgi:methylglyoxal/glyoxal reductase
MITTGKNPGELKLPPIGFGTWQLGQGTIAKKAVQTAIKLGYRLIDTAKLYGNENAVGEAVRKSGLKREELFITTKLWNDDQGYDSAIAACEASLDRLGMEYVDLYLIHWPVTTRRTESWRALVELQKRGKAKAIGVSNFTIRHLEELMRTSDVTPQVNQVEFHPFIYEQQKELLAFCNQNGIRLEAYSPISRLKGGIHPVIQEVCDQTGKLPSQVVLRWCIQRGTVPLPRSQNPEHIKINFDVFDFELDEQAMRSLDDISDGMRVTWDPSNMR